MSDVTFSVVRTVFDTATATNNELAAATFVIHNFTTQKNGVWGEKIGHGATGDPLLCPKEALRRLAHLRQHSAPMDSPLARFKMPKRRWKNVTPTMIMAQLNATVKILAGTHLGFTYQDVSARSLHAAGAISIICSGVDTDFINLIGRWRSNKIFQCIHVKAEPIMRNYSKVMISHGNYNLLLHIEVPIYLSLLFSHPSSAC